MLLTGIAPFNIRECRICGMRYKCPFYNIATPWRNNEKTRGWLDFLERLGEIKRNIVFALNRREISESVLRNANCIDEISTEEINTTSSSGKKRKINYKMIKLKERFFQDAINGND
ncbi:MAG TPA: hypothetical protein VMW10_11590 [Alphaproteobacteria bacterium]|nr:hypothetical protein [Alphaproteobacteria bacterium]